MSWYDYIPLGGSIARLAQGDYKQAGIDAIPVIGPGVQWASDKIGSAYDAKRQGLESAQTFLSDLGNEQRGFQMEGLNQAEGYYKPVQDRIKATYGTPGSFRK